MVTFGISLRLIGTLEKIFIKKGLLQSASHNLQNDF